MRPLWTVLALALSCRAPSAVKVDGQGPIMRREDRQEESKARGASFITQEHPRNILLGGVGEHAGRDIPSENIRENSHTTVADKLVNTVGNAAGNAAEMAGDVGEKAINLGEDVSTQAMKAMEALAALAANDTTVKEHKTAATALPVPQLNPIEGPIDIIAVNQLLGKEFSSTLYMLFTVVLSAASIFGLQAAFAKKEAPEEEEAEEVVTFRARFFNALPSAASFPVQCMISLYVVALYSRRGCSLASMALVMVFVHSVDQIADPLMSFMSDESDNPNGRRKPYLLMGAPIYGFFVYTLFSPPFLPSAPLLCWFGISYLCVSLSSNVVNIPYHAMAAEFSEDTTMRSAQFFRSRFMDAVGLFGALAIAFLVFEFATHLGIGGEICVETPQLVGQCQQGLTCDLYRQNGEGFELMKNAALMANMRDYEWGKEKIDCDRFPEVNMSTPENTNVLENFCRCIETCVEACDIAKRGEAFGFMGLVLGAWGAVTLLALAWYCDEKPQPADGRKPASFVPRYLSMQRNVVFMKLWPILFLETLSYGMFFVTLPFYVMYGITPEYMKPGDSALELDCHAGASSNPLSPTFAWQCNSMGVLAVCVCFTFACAIVASPLWYCFYGVNKALAWQLSSLITLVASAAFWAFGVGQVMQVVWACGTIGATLTARFLTDSYMADAVDYDEFLTGTRSEAAYMMFKHSVPKAVVGPVLAFTIALLYYDDHVPLVDGRIQAQPEELKLSMYLLTGGIPAICSGIALYLKLRFPIKSDAQMKELREAIEKHKAEEAPVDPITKQTYVLWTYTEEECKGGYWAMEHFPSLKECEDIAEDPEAAFRALSSTAMTKFSGWFILWVLSSLMTGYAAMELVQDRVLYVVGPVAALCMGYSAFYMAIAYSRWNAGKALVAQSPEADLIAKVFGHRKGLALLADGPPEEANAAAADGEGAAAADAPAEG